jgi:hypothetical protein
VSLDGAREPARKPGGLDATGSRMEDRAERALDPDTSGELVALEPADVLVANTELAVPGDDRARSGELRAACRHGERAADPEAAVDALGLDDPADLVDRVGRGGDQPADGVTATCPDVSLRDPRWHAHHPAAIPSARPEAGNLALQDDDAHVGHQPTEVERCPEACVPGPDDDDVGVSVTGERRSWREWLCDLLEPETPQPDVRFRGVPCCLDGGHRVSWRVGLGGRTYGRRQPDSNDRFESP